MTVYELIKEHVFPDPSEAENDGLLAIGGDLNVERILIAYASGIFPWYAKGQPIMWWSPDPRMVLFPNEFKKSKNLRRLLEKEKFTIKFDTNFSAVIKNCSSIERKGQTGTWITSDMIDAYINLYKKGYAHSVETYLDGKLVGGLYGVSLGGVFFGESMFHIVADASKVALWHLAKRLVNWQFDMIDVQQDTRHLKSLGARNIDRGLFLSILKRSLQNKTRLGSWNID